MARLNESSLKFYVPYIDGEFALEHHLYESIVSSANLDSKNSSEAQYNNQVRVIDINVAAGPGEEQARLSLDCLLIVNDPVFRALGVKPNIINLSYDY